MMVNRSVVRLFALVGALALPALPLFAQQQPASVLPGRPTSDAPASLLGPRFESKAAGISFSSPANSREIRKPGVPDLIVEYVNDEQQMVLKVATLELREARQLTESRDARGARQRGLLDETVDAFIAQNPVAELLRKDIDDLNGVPVGLSAYRYSQQTRRFLRQDAIIPLTDRYFYSLTMISPGSRGNSGEVDINEKLAADTFREVLDSVKLFDRSDIARDQELRIARSIEWLEALKGQGKIAAPLQAESWFRLVHDGKDIGYSYITEERTRENSRDGILVSIRSRTIPAAGQQADATSRMFIADAWNHEAWSHTASNRMGTKSESTAELGLADYGMHFRVQAPKNLLDTPVTDADKVRHPEIEEVGRWKVQVRTQRGTYVAPALERDLPEWYLPQAIQHLLPRLLPLDKPDGYMFVSFVSEHHQFMTRYADVGELGEVELEGQRFQAIPVTIRVGLDGSPTLYYVSPQGKYLGSESEFVFDGRKSYIRVVPSDEQSLLRLWKGAQLDKPRESEVPVIPNRPANTPGPR